jgi:hypothetical protein
MKPSYKDITSQISAPPSWWQKDGVPRWGDFSPDKAASIYATEVVLMEVECQACQTKFTVSICNEIGTLNNELAKQILRGQLHYGDPPNTGCCASGASMNSEPNRILEHWSTHHPEHAKDGIITDFDKYFEWRRNPAYEGDYKGWAGNTRPTGEKKV